MLRSSILRTAAPTLRITCSRTTLPLAGNVSILGNRASPAAAWARHVSTTSSAKDALTSKQSHQQATTVHRRKFIGNYGTRSSVDTFCRLEDQVNASSSPSPLATPDAVSTVPEMVRGDWVLFHPVYSPDELKAVEVGSLFILESL